MLLQEPGNEASENIACESMAMGYQLLSSFVSCGRSPPTSSRS